MNTELYINKVLGQDITLKPLLKQKMGNLPIYMQETYRFYHAELYHKELIFAEPKNIENLSILQTEKQFVQLKKVFGTIVLLMPQITAYNRARLIEKGINFVVPGKQLFLPDLLLDLRENELTDHTKRRNKTLLPSAQFLVIYHILHRDKKWQMEQHAFKDIAEKTGYTRMAITKAVDNLKEEEIIDVTGEKEKFIRFRLSRPALWNDLLQRKLFVDPVLKRVYFDNMPHPHFKLLAGASALPEYSDMNPSRQMSYAIEKTAFYYLLEKNNFINLNEQEGKIGLEVWKYDPLKLVADMPNDLAVVDPLSLYLSLLNSTDERIEMALEQIEKTYIW